MLGGAAEIAAGDETEAFDRVHVTVPGGAGPVLRSIPDIIARQVERRCSARVISDGPAPFTLELAVEPGIGKEGFKIAAGPHGAGRIVGDDERGVLYGAGKFLRSSRYGRGFAPSAWRFL